MSTEGPAHSSKQLRFNWDALFTGTLQSACKRSKAAQQRSIRKCCNAALHLLCSKSLLGRDHSEEGLLPSKPVSASLCSSAVCALIALKKKKSMTSFWKRKNRSQMASVCAEFPWCYCFASSQRVIFPLYTDVTLSDIHVA